jgi:hypothetical protein
MLLCAGFSSLATTDSPPSGHPLIVHNGTGDGRYMQGEQIDISASVPEGYAFLCWMEIQGGGHIHRFSRDTTYTMPDRVAIIAAVFGKIESWFPPGPENGIKGLLLPKKPNTNSQFRMEQKIRISLNIGQAYNLSAAEVWDRVSVTADWFPGPEAINTWHSSELVKYYDKNQRGTEITKGGSVPKAVFMKSSTGVYVGSIWYVSAWTQEEAATKTDRDGNLIRPEVSTAMKLDIHGKNFSATRATAAGALLPVDIKVHQTQNGPQGSAPKYNNAPKDYMASNLFSVWPNEAAIVKVKLPAPFGQQQNLPPNLIKWEVPGHNIADNTLEATLSWPLSFGGNLKEVKITIGGSLYKVHIKVQGVGIISEVEAAVLVPNASPIMLAYKSESETYAHSTYGITPKADAIRHGYWCSLSVSTFPVTAGDVDIISTAHEYRNRYSDNQQAFNSTMDLQNNAVGATVNHQVNGLPDRTAIKSELEQRYSSGEMYIWEVPRGAASQSQRDSEGILIKSNKTRIY